VDVAPRHHQLTQPRGQPILHARHLQHPDTGVSGPKLGLATCAPARPQTASNNSGNHRLLRCRNPLYQPMPAVRFRFRFRCRFSFNTSTDAASPSLQAPPAGLRTAHRVGPGRA
jgi:hypothetical protein